MTSPEVIEFRAPELLTVKEAVERLHGSSYTETDINRMYIAIKRGTIQCSEIPKPECEEFDVMIEVECIDSGEGGTIWDINIYCPANGYGAPVDGGPTVSSVCDPLCLVSKTFDFSDGGICSDYSCIDGNTGYDVCVSEEPCP